MKSFLFRVPSGHFHKKLQVTLLVPRINYIFRLEPSCQPLDLSPSLVLRQEVPLRLEAVDEVVEGADLVALGLVLAGGADAHVEARELHEDGVQ